MKAKIWDNLVKKRIYPVKMCLHLQTYLDYIPEYWRDLWVWTQEIYGKSWKLRDTPKDNAPTFKRGEGMAFENFTWKM